MKKLLRFKSLPVVAPLVAAGFFASSAQAAPFDPGHFPEKTKILFHIDMEKPVLSGLSVTLDEILPDHPALKRLSDLGVKSKVLDMSVCAFGDSVDTLKGSLLVHTDGKVDAFVAALESVTKEKQVHGAYTIHGWADSKIKLWFALHPAKQIFVCSDSVDAVKVTLDAMNDDQKLDLSELPFKDLKDCSAFLSALDLRFGGIDQDILNTGSEIIKLCKKMVVSFHSSDQGDFKIRLNFKGDNEESAALVRSIGEGILGFLEGKWEQDLPLKGKVSVDGTNVKMELSTSIDEARKFGESILGQLEIPKKYGPLFQGLADKLQEMANKANESE